jgi:hypothetical protein
MSDKTKKSAEVTQHKPSAKMQEQIDDCVRAAVKKAFGKIVPVTGCLGMRNSNSAKGGAPYQRYFLANGHTVFVSGWHQEGGPRVTVSEKMADRKSYTVKRHLEMFARKQARIDAKAAAEAAKQEKPKAGSKGLAKIA